MPVEPAAESDVEALPPPPPPEEGKIKLKIKLPGAAAQETLYPPVETVPPAEEAMAEPPVLPPFPVVAPPPPEDEELDAPPMIPLVSAKYPPPPIPTDGSRPSVFKRPRVPAALLAAERRKRMWKYALIAVGGVVLAGAIIFGAFLKFSEPPPPIRIPTRDRTPVPQATVQTPVPEKVVTKPKLEPVVPNEAGRGTRVDSTATVELTPGVMATTESVKAVPNASSAFRTFVASARINGVYQGTPPRAFINGRLVRTGEMIDSTMEIYFDSVDLTTRSIVFKDSTGATVSRRY